MSIIDLLELLVDLPRPVAWLDIARSYEVPLVIDATRGSFRMTRFKKSKAIGLIHLTKVCELFTYHNFEVTVYSSTTTYRM